MASVTNVSGNEIRFETIEGDVYRLAHYQDCCESVRVEDIAGNLENLVGSPLTMAEESSSENETPIQLRPPEYAESYTWTFYRFATKKGYVTIRFLGESNGYYSERVDFVKDTSNA